MSRAGMPLDINDEDITGSISSLPLRSIFSLTAFSSFTAVVNLVPSREMSLEASSC